jgi:hypothetical protein
LNKIKILRTGSSCSRNSSSQQSGADKKIKISIKNLGKIKIRNRSEDEKSPLADVPQRPVTDLKLEGHGATRKLLKSKISVALNKN